MVVIEWSVYSRILPKHISKVEPLAKEFNSLTDERNSRQATVDWQFLTTDARTQLKQFDPSTPV